MKNILATLIILFFYYNAKAQPAGTLDSTFNETGINQIHFDGYADIPQGVCVSADGSVYSAVNISLPVLYPISVVIKYKPDGTIDNTFGVDGIANIQYADDEFFVSGIQAQPDGKILVFGGHDFGGYICRLLPDGNNDTDFGTGGFVFFDYGLHSNSTRCIAIQPDGKILAGGIIRDDDSSGDYFIIRVNADGSVDNTFAGDGYIRGDLNMEDFVFDITLSDDGKILAGIVSVGISGSVYYNSYIGKFTSDGATDGSFSADGIQQIPIPVGITDGILVQTLLLQSDNKIIAVVNSEDEEGLSPPYIYRFLSDGTLDNSFGDEGITFLYEPSVKVEIENCAMQADDKIIIAGGLYNDDIDGKMYLKRLLPNGALDPSFIFNSDSLYNAEYEWIYDMALQPDYKIVLTGTVGNSGYDLYTMRLLNDIFPVIDNIKNSETQKIHIYPNPALNILHVDLNKLNASASFLQIIDMTGRILITQNITDNTVAVSIGKLPAGNYFIKIIADEKTITEAFQKIAD